jgi:simple sugar transport system ATP-binding protein
MTAYDLSPVVEVRNIVKSYGGIKALDDVSMTLRSGNVHCLAGENGCGKSTLIKIISGVEQPDSGQILINGKSQGRLTPLGAILAGIQVIYQDFSLFPNLTVAENITITSLVANRAAFFSPAKSKEEASIIVRELGLELDLDATVQSLSVANKQLTAICRALVNDAKVIVMDEPTTALTHTEVGHLFEVVNRLRERGVALVFVSHKLEEALEVSQDITILRNGLHIISGAARDFDRDSLTMHITGRQIKESREITAPIMTAQPLLEVSNLTRNGKFENVSFTLHRGEILGITGLLGSGRTEIAEALFGVNPAQAGSISVDGRLVSIRSIQDSAKVGIGYLPEDRLTQGLFQDKSVGDNLIAASLDNHRNKWGLLRTTKILRTIEEMFTRLRIKAPSSLVPVRSLSGGNAQRVVLGKLLANHPKVLILNGPTVGVDVGSKEQILNLLRGEANEGMGIIVISDDSPELVAVCNRVLIVRQGRIVNELAGLNVSVKQIQELTAA